METKIEELKILILEKIIGNKSTYEKILSQLGENDILIINLEITKTSKQ